MTTIKLLYEKFLKIEEDLGLFKEKIDGVYFWERMRFDIFMTLVYSDAGVSSKTQTRAKSKLRYYLSSILNIWRNPFFSRKKNILFMGTSRRVQRRDGLWWDIYIDKILESLGNQYVSFEYPTSSFKHFTPPKTKNLRYLDFTELLSHLSQFLGISKVTLTMDQRILLAHIQYRIKKDFGKRIEIEKKAKLLLKKRKARLPLYTWLLRLIKPKAVVVVVGYGKEDIIEACKSLKIPVLELQHGVIHQFHLGYSFKGKERRKQMFPDYLLSFGEYWKEHVEYPIPKDRIIPVGYPLMEEEQKKYSKAKKKQQIVFISQQLSGEALSKFALELSEMKDNPYKIVFKLQPQECETWKEAYPWLIDADMEVVDRRSDVLHKILAESDVQIGVSSTAIFEGMAFDLKTYLIDGAGVELFDPLVKEGLVHKATSPEFLLKHLKEKGEDSKFDTEYIFKSGATRSIVEFIKNFESKSEVKK